MNNTSSRTALGRPEFDSLETGIMNWTSNLQQSMEQEVASVNDGSDIFAECPQPNHATLGVGQGTATNLMTPHSTPEESLLVPSFDFGIDIPRFPFAELESPSQDSGIASPRPSTPPRPPVPQRSVLDSQSILACTQIIGNLENYIKAELKSLDLVLGITKQALETLRSLVELHSSGARPSYRCLALFGVVMYQIVELFEAGCASTLEQEKESDSAHGGLEKLHGFAGGTVPGLGFNLFKVDVQEQRAYQARLALKEVEQSSKMLQGIMALAGTGRWGEERLDCQPDEMRADYRDITRRMHILCEALGKARNT